MSQAVFLDLFEAQSRWVGSLVEPWEGERDPEEIAPSLERAIPALVEVCRLMEEVYPPLCRSLFDNLAEQGALVPGTRYYDMYRRVYRAIVASAKMLHEAEGRGLPVRDLKELDTALGRFRRLMEEKIEHLPRINLEEIARSTAAYERGEARPLRELIDELRRRAD